jgi:hypothetical protein
MTPPLEAFAVNNFLAAQPVLGKALLQMRGTHGTKHALNVHM